MNPIEGTLTLHMRKERFGYVEITGKEKPTNIALFVKNLGLVYKLCFEFHLVGIERMEEECTYYESDRKIL